ncbi:uncharacterized protein ACA1_203660, partial [Acanthamoeba castellanii str. Neff]
PEEEVRALRHVAIVSQRKATTGDAHVNRNAAKHTLHLALDVAERVGLEWRLYFLLELAKLAWEEHNLAQALKYIAQAKQIATQADQPHFLALFILVETYLAFARRDIGAVVQHLQQYKQTHDAFAQGQNETWVSLQVMYDILSLEHCFVEGDVPRAKAHAKSICAYVQGVNAKGVVVRSFFKWCDASMLGAYYYYAGGAVDRISVPSRAITFFKEGRSRIDVLRDGQAMIEILKTKDREVMSLLRLKFALLEQLFLAHLTQSDYAQAVQVLWDMLDMNCAWADRNPEWPSTAHLLAGHLATVCLPEQAATHYIVASQILQQQQQWDTAVIADLFACLALLRASAFKKALAHAPLYSTSSALRGRRAAQVLEESRGEPSPGASLRAARPRASQPPLLPIRLSQGGAGARAEARTGEPADDGAGLQRHRGEHPAGHEERGRRSSVAAAGPQVLQRPPRPALAHHRAPPQQSCVRTRDGGGRRRRRGAGAAGRGRAAAAGQRRLRRSGARRREPPTIRPHHAPSRAAILVDPPTPLHR